MASTKTKTSSRTSAAPTPKKTSSRTAGAGKKKTSSKAKVAAAAAKSTARVSSAKKKAAADKAAKSTTPGTSAKTTDTVEKKTRKKTTTATASAPSKKKKSTAEKSAKGAAAGTTVKTIDKKDTAIATKAPLTKKKTSKKTATDKDAAAVEPKSTAPAEKKTKTKKKSGSKSGSGAAGTKGYSVAEVASKAQADAQGYVFINGRRVRMISTKGVPVKKPVKSNAKDEGDDDAPKRPKNLKTHLSKKELNHYRTLLIEKRHEIVGDLGAIEQEALRNLDGGTHMPIHMADVGTDTYDQDFMLGLAEAERKQLAEIDDALLRIQQNTYGVCVMTGNPIPEARLEAKPWAKYTIEAARQLEGNFSP